MTKLILLDSVLQEDRVLAPQGPSSISAVAELVSYIISQCIQNVFLLNFKFSTLQLLCASVSIANPPNGTKLWPVMHQVQRVHMRGPHPGACQGGRCIFIL